MKEVINCPPASPDSVAEVIIFLCQQENGVLGRIINSSTLWLRTETCFMKSLVHVWDLYSIFFHSNFLKLWCLRIKFRSPPDLISIIHNWLECSRRSLSIVAALSMPRAEKRGSGSDISWQKTTNICQLHQQLEMFWYILSVSFPKLLVCHLTRVNIGVPSCCVSLGPWEDWERTDTHLQVTTFTYTLQEPRAVFRPVDQHLWLVQGHNGRLKLRHCKLKAASGGGTRMFQRICFFKSSPVLLWSTLYGKNEQQ